jgi:hypothetical protein
VLPVWLPVVEIDRLPDEVDVRLDLPDDVPLGDRDDDLELDSV